MKKKIRIKVGVDSPSAAGAGTISKMIGKVLDLVEASLPEGTQCDKFKKLVQQPLYDFRQEMLLLDANGVPKDLE